MSIDMLQILQDALVEADINAAKVRETAEYNSEIYRAERYALDCWVQLVAYKIKQEHGIHVDKVVGILNED